MLEEVRSFGDPLMVFTGGDPLKRPDLLPLIEKSVCLGLRTTVTPSATPLLTEGAIERFRDCGLARMAISLDGPDSESHDGFRSVNGSFNCTILALEHAQRIGLQPQVNTTVTRHNVGLLGEIARLVERVGAKLRSVFFLVATRRASASQDLTAGRVRRGLRFPLQSVEDRPIRHQDHGSPALSPLRGSKQKGR